MKGQAAKCDNCGHVTFRQDRESLYGKLAVFLSTAEDEEDDIYDEFNDWFSVNSAEYDKKTKKFNRITKEYCSIACLEFAVQYTYGKNEVPTIEGEK